MTAHEWPCIPVDIVTVSGPRDIKNRLLTNNAGIGTPFHNYPDFTIYRRKNQWINTRYRFSLPSMVAHFCVWRPSGEIENRTHNEEDPTPVCKYTSYQHLVSIDYLPNHEVSIDYGKWMESLLSWMVTFVLFKERVLQVSSLDSVYQRSVNDCQAPTGIFQFQLYMF